MFVFQFISSQFVSVLLQVFKQSHILHFVFRASDNANTVGQVKLTVGYSVEESRLFITVHSCRSLCDFNSLQTNVLPGALGTNTRCVCVRPTEPWQPAPKMVQTLMFPSSCCLTRRLPPRGELPPRRETSTQNSTRGETNKRDTRNSEGSARMLWLTFFSLCVGLTLISLWRSPYREDWTCLWRTASPSWAESGSLSARYTPTRVSEMHHHATSHIFLDVYVILMTRHAEMQKCEATFFCFSLLPTVAAGPGSNWPQGWCHTMVIIYTATETYCVIMELYQQLYVQILLI